MTERLLNLADQPPTRVLQGNSTEVEKRLVMLFREGWKIVPGKSVWREHYRSVQVQKPEPEPVADEPDASPTFGGKDRT